MKVGRIVLGNKQVSRGALTLPPEVSRVVLLDLRLNDVLVIECDHPLSMEASAQLKAYCETVFPDHRVAVLGDGMTLRVVRPQEDTP